MEPVGGSLMCRGDGTEQFDGPSTFTAKVTLRGPMGTYLIHFNSSLQEKHICIESKVQKYGIVKPIFLPYQNRALTAMLIYKYKN
jgi:hypothetical protein